MYAQVTELRAPFGKIGELRLLIEEEYLPIVRKRPGFKAAFLLEQVDDPDAARLVQLWDNQAAIEDFHRTGLLQGSDQSIAARLPGLRVQRQGYLVRLATSVSVEAAKEMIG
jgi:quinol monooxygenase YgiN